MTTESEIDLAELAEARPHLAQVGRILDAALNPEDNDQ
ncbi:hypothetical protein PBI_SQUIRTY_84 [Mycobacterium phage Squirty]|uniref:Uncharacterized protein n=1 Tax=Mycobacterium phage Squirty TaxID=1527512 RepID=A0A088FBN2_9CAUD|nr:hypothetical protein PBI_SQUIRTY_84 [Mycobacterium phage Squirty]AIM41031.1 hypothetical protein PBI_SQUIRTY_84 [Mycobacterium phage Squirty]